MWTYDSDYNRWVSNKDNLKIDNYELLKQELSSVRFYSKCLSGATYLPMNDINNIYDILGEYEDRNWYIGLNGSPYSNSLIPPQHAIEITDANSNEYYTKYLSEYGLTLKNLFTPNRLIKDSIKNYIYVDVATTTQLFDLEQPIINRNIDGVRLKEGHRVLIKDQKSTEVLPNTTIPEDYFEGPFEVVQNLGATIEYEYYNNQNGIYRYENNLLVKESDLDDYDNCVRFSVVVKLGTNNREKQFHLTRLNNGYYPTSSLDQPMRFIEKHNWLLRNRVDYNNLFEINYYDVIKQGEQTYNIGGVTYSIPERTISVGEFGVIHNFQENVSNIISNKYKQNLRGIAQTSKYYWICGDSGLLLKVRKHDFNIEKVEVDCRCPRNLIISNLNSISFYDDLRGVTVGDLNTLLVTEDGGLNWEKIRIEDFNPYYFNKVVYYNANNFFIGGNAGVFIEFKKDIGGWTAYKRRISRFIDEDDEYLLVDNINDLYYTNINNWGLSYSFSTQSTATERELLFIVTDDSKFIVHDINGSTNFDFLYLDFNTGIEVNNYGDIRNIVRRQGTNTFYFTGIEQSTGDSGLFSFDIDVFDYIGVNNEYSNTIATTFSATFESNLYPNETFDYNGDELIICGNESLLESSTYSTSFNFDVFDVDFENRLKSKMLFLDYDMASKLNWFTDDGEYRLPNSLTFSGASFSVGSYLSFEPLIYVATAPSFMTQSETTWYQYWADRNKTFEYYSSNPLDESSMALISFTFSYSSTQSEINVSSLTSSLNGIINLAPSIDDEVTNRYDGSGPPAPSAPSAPYDLYLYNYLMISKVPSTYYAEVGDVMRLESNVVDGEFIINKIFTSGGNKYLYMFSEFNQNIITELSTTTYPITLTNLNKYSDVEELEERFNLHPISKGYEFIYSTSSTIADLNPIFSSETSYYNLSTGVNLSGDYSEMSYTSGFLKFGYTPTYNLLDYLESINDIGDPNPVFYGDKEYYAMPDYRGIPLQGVGNINDNIAYIDYNGITYSNTTGNRILFGKNLKLEWESIFVNTFVDVNLYDGVTYPGNYTTTERLLVMKKYFSEKDDAYVIEFHKKLNHVIGTPQYFVDIISRRKLHQISEDLQELNNIQRAKLKTTNGLFIGSSFDNYERELNFKIPTDSYAKILLSDAETIQELSAIFYIDYKNELSMNITRLERQYKVPISTTSNYLGKLFISCSEKHDLKTGDGVVLEFNGGTGSSQELNQQYFGYHNVIFVNQFNFYIDIPYGTTPLVGNDTGFVNFTKKDPFLNYTPVDIIDVGVDKKGKRSIELSVDNLQLKDDVYSLINVDFNKYRFRLVDGLNVEQLAIQFPWILEAEISGAVLGVKNGQLVWYKGSWECGRWFDGIWYSGSWLSGDWYGGEWYSKIIKDNYISVQVDEKSSDTLQSTWFGGRWFGGLWNNGLWVNGRWYGGTWDNGIWYKGIWNDGTWNNGLFGGGIWILGDWNNGVFNTDNEPAYWLDGNWYGGDFENGMWYNGLFEAKNAESRFGTKAYNSRTATWHGGDWVSGSFHSRLNINDDGEYDVSDVHKYSIWRTGKWFSGEFYGGIAYNMDFNSGIWHGGILEDIQVIGFGSDGVGQNYFTLNGKFKFNTGDEINIIDNQIGNTYSSDFGSNDNPGRYTVLYVIEDDENNRTKVYVNSEITYDVSAPVYLGLRVVSRFRFCNWKSGIWTNGLYEGGLYEGGIWYNGVFGDATWM